MKIFILFHNVIYFEIQWKDEMTKQYLFKKLKLKFEIKFIISYSFSIIKC